MKIELSKHGTLQWATEFHFIYHRFMKEMEGVGTPLSEFIPPIKASIHPNNILICLPYWLLEFVDKIPPLNNIRALSLGNLFGSLYCIEQDKVLDNMKEVSSLPTLNVYYYKWLKEYQRLFNSDSYFWILFEKFLIEYTNSIVWERKEHYGVPKAFREDEFRLLGKKLAPLKMCCAGICIMDHKEDFVWYFSELIEHYHTGFQLADDLRDWREDLERKNYTYVLTLACEELGNEEMAEHLIEDVLRNTDIASRVLERSLQNFERAKKLSIELGCSKLTRFITYEMEKSRALLKNAVPMTTREHFLSPKLAASDVPIYRSEVHIFKGESGFWYLFDVESSRFFEIDPMTQEVLECVAGNVTTSNVATRFEKLYSRDEVEALLNELLEMNILSISQSTNFATAHQPLGDYSGVSSLVLEIARSDEPCLKVMEEAMMREGIHFLFKNGWQPQLRLTFLIHNALNDDVMRLLSFGTQYAARLAKKLHKKILFSLLVGDLIISDERSVIRLVSLSDISWIHTTVSLASVLSAPGRLKMLIANAHRMLQSGKKLYVTLSVPTSDGLHDDDGKRIQTVADLVTGLGRDAVHLLGGNDSSQQPCSIVLLTSDIVGRLGRFTNVTQLMQRLDSRIHRPYFCEAGRKYLAVDIAGRVYPCHKFMCARMCEMGNVIDGIHREQRPYIRAHVDRKEACRTCWARNICGGGCFYHFFQKNGKIDDPDAQWCNQFRKNLESVIDLYQQICNTGGGAEKSYNSCAGLCDLW